ncbi:MAG: hypothetical protein WAW62_04925 [Candidatus Saccharimonas aalborgensis]
MAITPRADAQAVIDEVNAAILADAETQLNNLILRWVENGGGTVITITVPARIPPSMLGDLREKIKDAGWQYELNSGTTGWILAVY